MYTVVIAEEEHLKSIDEYALYLEPFLDSARFSVCRWNTEATGGLDEIVPELEKNVDRRSEWRAVILCDERGLAKRNPFNIVEYQEPKEEPGEDPKAYGRRRLRAKGEAFRAASREPLVRLVTHLCEDPLLCAGNGEPGAGKKSAWEGPEETWKIPEEEGKASEETWGKTEMAGETPEETWNLREEAGRNQEETWENSERVWKIPAEEPANSPEEEPAGREYRGYSEYLAEARLKQEIRREIRRGASKQIAAPAKILCIAKRHREDFSDELAGIWQERDEREYSRFYDWNLYYDRMRYLIFDIEEKQKKNYRSDYIRFLNVVCILAANEEPTGCLRPERVYRLVCDADEGSMACILRRYIEKLNVTKEALREKIEDIRQAEEETLKDAEVRNAYCSKVTIPVRMQLEMSHTDMKFLKKTGLASDCPVNCEEELWTAFYEKNRRDVRKLLREPPRAIRQAAEQVRMICSQHEDVDAHLTPDQLGEIEHHIAREELAMSETEIGDVYHNRRIYTRMEKLAHAVRTEMERRMKSIPLALFGLLPLLAVLLGMVPVWLKNRESAGYAELLTRLGAGVFVSVAVAGMIYLVYCWWVLRKKIKDYNVMIENVMREVDLKAEQYSKYLSHVCNFMRTTEAFGRYKERLGVNARRIGGLKKHIQDIDRCRADVEDIFREFLHYDGPQPEMDAIPYDYDFERTVDYAYPIPPMPDMRKQIVFMERGRTVPVPYGTISGLTLRREELYD